MREASMAQDANQRLADELAIRDVIARIGMVRAFGTPEEYVGLFTEDAVWEHVTPDGEPYSTGRDYEIDHFRENIAAGRSGPGSHAHHIIPTTIATVNGDRATAVSQLLFVNNADAKPNIVKMWILHDELVRTPDGWRISRRRFQKP
jgi:hypothetical protein